MFTQEARLNPPGLNDPSRKTGFLRSHWRWWVGALAICILAAGVYVFFAKPGQAQSAGGKQAQNPAARSVPVVAVPAKTGDVGVYLNGLGSVTPLNTVTVKSRVDGQLMKVLFREGQVVRAGDLLAEIDPRPFQVQLDQAEGQLARDQALLKNAQLDLERYRVLVEQDSIPKQQLDTQASLVRQYEGAVKVDQAAIDNAKLQLVYCRITAPISGRLGLRLVDAGNMVHATDTTGLVVITQLQPITVVFTIPEDSLPQVHEEAARGGAAHRRRLRPRAEGEARYRLAADGRQSDRPDHRHGPSESRLRQRRQRAVPQSVRQRAPAARREEGRDGGAVGRDPARHAGRVRLCGQGRPDRRVRGRSRSARRRATTRRSRPASRPASWSWSTAPTSCETAARSRSRLAKRAPARAKRQVVNLSRPFILRPVATSLLMVALLLAGAVAYRLLPVSALPQVDYPTIQVVTFYPGASPDVMASSVTAPLERQFGQMPGLNQMTSTSSGGSSVITLQFSLDLNLDVAEQEVQAAINAAFTFLPKDLPNPPVYSKVNPADAPVLTLALTSKTLPLPAVEDLADTRLAQKISQLPGVGLVSIGGGQRPAVRVQANPTALASYELGLEDLRSAIAAANVNQAKGTFDGQQRAFTIAANDQLLTSREYRPLIVAYRNGAPVHLSDVADVIDDAENVKQAAWMNDVPAVIVNIQRQPGANVIEVVDRIKKLLPQLQGALPAAVQVSVLTDRTTTIRASVRDVQFTLMLSVALVVMVIFLFLRNLAATAIPSVSVPLSLVGTFGVMYLLGFSLDNLSLMALTIATGFVVDDAIVMIENIARYVEAGESPLEAALKGARQIGFTILSLTVSLIAVLIPLLFMGDVVGRLFREFAITLSVTILISAAVSLTLTPTMCARLLKHKPESEQSAFYRVTGRFIDRVIDFYARTLTWVLERQTATLVVAVATLAVTALLYIFIPKGFFPVQDTGVILGISEAPQSVSFQAMAERQQALAKVVLRGSCRREPVVVHRHRRHQRHPEQRTHPDQPEAARAARSERQRSDPAAAAEAGAGGGHHAVHAAGAGSCRSKTA